MRYVQPYGVTDLDAPYINGDPSIGRMGSIPPAEAFEHPMRELVHVIEANKLTPDEADLHQIIKGVRSQRSNYVEDTGSVNTLSVAFDPPIAAYTIGLPIRVKVYSTNTGPSTIDAGGGRVAIRKPTGAEIQAGDLPAGGLVELVYDGTNFQMINFGGAGGGLGDVYMVNVPYCVDSSATANQITANFSPAITALQAGTIFMVKVANTNTSFTNINVNGLGNKPVYAQGGSPNWPLLPSDLIAGDVLIFTYDGTRFWIYANTILNQWVNFNVTTNAEFNALFVALGRKRILADVGVNIYLAIGIYGPLVTEHPNANRIAVWGTMKAARPVFGDFQKTGNTPAARAQDSANNIAMLRTRYGTEVRFDNASYIPGLSHRGAGTISYRDILVTGANVDAGAAKPGILGVSIGLHSSMHLMNVTVWGSGAYGYVANGGQMSTINCFACGCFTDGFNATGEGHIFMQECGSYGNAWSGVSVSHGSSVSLWRSTGLPGITDLAPVQVMANGIAGAYCANMSFVLAMQPNVSGNVLDFQANAASNISIVAGTVYATTSPALNVVGNGNSIITG